MFPKPDHDLQILLDALESAWNRKLGFFSKNPVPGLLEKLSSMGNPAALPYLLAMVHHPNADVRESAEQAVTRLLPKLREDQIVDLETTLRESWLKFYSDGHEFRATSCAGWKLSTLAASGWRREKAVIALTKAKDEAALPFMLLRLNDWVTQVRKAAETWFSICADSLQLRQIVDCLPILAALTERSHGRASQMVQSLLKRLENRESTPDLLRRLSFSNARSRRLIFSVLSKNGALDDLEVQNGLIQHSNPILGVLLLKCLRQQGPELPDHLLDLAVASKSSLLRRVALNCLTDTQVERFIPSLSKALFDPAQGVRAFAQYHLSKRISAGDLQDSYNEALQSPMSTKRVLTASILGFHETGGKWSTSHYEQWSNHPSSRVRVAVMRCFASSRFEDALPWLRRELALENSPALGKVALTLLLRQPYALSLDEISRLLSGGEPAVVRLRGFCLLCARGKWEQLPLLFSLTRDAYGNLRHKATLRLVAWLQGFNRSQIQPSRDQIEMALAELSKSKNTIPTKLVCEFDALLRAMTAE